MGLLKVFKDIFAEVSVQHVRGMERASLFRWLGLVLLLSAERVALPFNSNSDRTHLWSVLW